MTSRTASGASPIDTFDARATHQPGDALAADPHAGTESELGMDAWRTVGATRLAVDLDDRGGQRVILSGPCTGVRLAITPFVVAGGRHLHHATRRRDRQVRAVLGDEGEDHFGRTFSLAKYAAARLRISTSISNARFSRRSFTNSARSSVVSPSRRPESMSAWFNQFRRQPSEIPRSFAICAIGFARSRANSTARAWNSGGCGAGIRTPLRGGRPPQRTCPEKRGLLSQWFAEE